RLQMQAPGEEFQQRAFPRARQAHEQGRLVPLPRSNVRLQLVEVAGSALEQVLVRDTHLVPGDVVAFETAAAIDFERERLRRLVTRLVVLGQPYPDLQGIRRFEPGRKYPARDAALDLAKAPHREIALDRRTRPPQRGRVAGGTHLELERERLGR